MNLFLWKAKGMLLPGWVYPKGVKPMGNVIEQLANFVMVLNGYPFGAVMLAVLVWLGTGGKD